MRAAPSGLSSELKAKMSQSIRRNQAAIGHATGEARFFRTKQSMAYNRMNSVSADDGVS